MQKLETKETMNDNKQITTRTGLSIVMLLNLIELEQSVSVVSSNNLHKGDDVILHSFDIE